MRKILNTFITGLEDLLFPSSCIKCFKHSSRDLICSSCKKNLVHPATKILKKKSLEVELFSLFFYEQPFQRIITSKFFDDKSFFVEAGNFAFKSSFLKRLNLSLDSILVPVPIHWSRWVKRGFNQAEVFSNQISFLKGPKTENLLLRKKMTKFQSCLKKNEKIENLKNAFLLDQEALEFKNKEIVLIDDLCTSGATILEAAKTISRLKPKSIKAFVICRK